MLKTWIVYGTFVAAMALINRIKPGYISSIGFYMVLVVPLISFLHLLISYQVFRIHHEVDVRLVSKGDKVTYKIKLENPLPLLLTPISLHFLASEKLFLEAREEEKKQIVLYPHGRNILRKELLCNYRGNYVVGVDEIILRDYVGFFNLTYHELEQHKIMVYPKLRELKSNILRHVMNESSESVVALDAQSQSVFTDIRPFIPGDTMNRIHWKLSAKRGEWLTKEFTGQMTNDTSVFLDTYHLALNDEDTIIYEDYLVEGCVSLIHYLLENRVTTSLYYERIGQHHLEGKDSHDFPVFYDAMAKLSFYHEDHFYDMISKVLREKQETKHLIMMTQKIDLPLAQFFVQLNYQNYEISIILLDHRAIQGIDLHLYSDRQAMFLLESANIPIYYLRHEQESTILGVNA
ncbi:MAG: DUF58 domain-containing protein [Vallitaleaceae bacterium]|nr:DUF58 domain-containing protein [Vallitaleaceae bacterium]